jgi:hypothetical protein
MAVLISSDRYTTDVLAQVLDLVVRERHRQDQKWGSIDNFDSRPLPNWLAILAEEFGEVAEEVCEIGVHGLDTPERRNALRNELIQVAAVAVAMIEHLDRKT